MARVYVMCGLPFSGKTTTSKKIAQITGATRISFDESWVRLEKSDHNFPQDKIDGWRYVNAACEAMIEDQLQSQKDVVYDNLGGRIEHRDVVKKIAERNHADYVIVYINVSLDELRRRQAQNKITSERNDVDEELFQDALIQFQEPTEEEGKILTITPQTNVEAVMAQKIHNY